MQIDPQAAYRTRLLWREKPELFYRDVLDMELYNLQVEIARSVVVNRTTSVASCNSAGKTGFAGGLVPWYLLSYDASIVVTTAPTWRQVKDLLWREINTKWEKAAAKGIQLGPEKPNVTSVQIAPNWFAVGVSSKDPNRVQGYHADSGRILVIADEAAAIEQLMFEGFYAILTSEHARFVMLGNPTSQSGEFRDSFKPGSLAHRIRIDAFDTPNFVANNIRTEDDLIAAIESKRELKKPYPSLVSPIWAYERLKKWGINSPMYQSRVRAKFPEIGENTLIPLSQIEAATTNERLDKILGLNLTDGDDAQEKANDKIRKAALKKYMAESNDVRGGDIARFGSDSTVITNRWRKIIGFPEAHHKEDTMQTAGRLWQKIVNLPTDLTLIDVIGVGGGVVDRLHELQSEQIALGHGQFAQIIGVDVATKATEIPDGMPQMEFANLRAELYWELRQMFEDGEIYLMPDEKGNPPEDLMDELSCIQYLYRGNKIFIEEKAEMKKRLDGKSPDRADSVMLTLAQGDPIEWTIPGEADERTAEEIEDDDADFEPVSRTGIGDDDTYPSLDAEY